jgi:hypothetical protein
MEKMELFTRAACALISHAQHALFYICSVIFLPLALVFAVRCTDPNESDEECGLLVNEVIEALDRLMDFFYNNLNLLIADGFVGIAIAQGTIFFCAARDALL